jgi:DNA repair protein RadC
MKEDVIATESFTHYGKTYFFDYLRAANGTDYIRIARSDRQPDDHFEKQCVVIFEENFPLLLEAMSALFRTAGYQKAAGIDRQRVADRERMTGIKSWDSECRPREKLLLQGREAMADAELIAMLIGGGSPKQTAVDLAAHILKSIDFSLSRLSRLTIEELCSFKGMGHAKSSSIISAMELAVRLTKADQSPFYLKAASH